MDWKRSRRVLSQGLLASYSLHACISAKIDTAIAFSYCTTWVRKGKKNIRKIVTGTIIIMAGRELEQATVAPLYIVATIGGLLEGWPYLRGLFFTI